MLFNDNFLFNSDSYKYHHPSMMPKGLTQLHSYYEAREGAEFDNIVFNGLFPLLLNIPVITRENIEELKPYLLKHFGYMPDISFLENVVTKNGGYMPVRIRALPEGSIVKPGTVMFTVENTDVENPGIVNFLETYLSNIWYPINVATLSREVKKVFKYFLSLTSDNLEHIEFMLHDFGMRGTTCMEQAMIGGAAHLINFKGTDTFNALRYINHIYNRSTDSVAGYSVPASEHSVMTILGRDGEEDAVRRILDSVPDNAIVSIVCDSYNYLDFCKMIGSTFKDRILARSGKVVIRPDSGEPKKVIQNVFESLAKDFGYTVNSKGFKKLNDKIGIIWGDGLTYSTIKSILEFTTNLGYAADNFVFGMGGGLLQKHNRDTNRCAFKTSYAVVDGKPIDVYKDPIDGKKKSKRGKFSVIKKLDGLVTVPYDESLGYNDLLQTVYSNGVILGYPDFEMIRKRAAL